MSDKTFEEFFPITSENFIANSMWQIIEINNIHMKKQLFLLTPALLLFIAIYELRLSKHFAANMQSVL
jgi:hypothetical protein